MRYLVYYDRCDDDTGRERRAYWAHAQPPMGTITNSAPYRVLTELQARRMISDHAEELRDTARSGVRHVIVEELRGECIIYVTNFFADFSAEKIRAAVRVADQAVYEKRRRERQRRRYCRIFRQ